MIGKALDEGRLMTLEEIRDTIDMVADRLEDLNNPPDQADLCVIMTELGSMMTALISEKYS